jgi:anti-anti-sigma factor
MLEITRRQASDVTVFDLAGNIILGGGSRQLGEEVREAVQGGDAHLLLNFENVKYIDSSGVGELFSLRDTISQAGGRLKLSNLPPKVEQVLSLSGVMPMFEIYDDENAALADT